ncbi:Aste57867_19103 [Aphanomyces stellatus]|uniref:Aste57867_19103 protein n=1 Tax=Aphanomyces stellatus TaxID=120398 RepID=A0A485LBR8_9STRA|nr:hypothetical protein As57867_019039 [Aphanomyces stellatus]VFT95827.1 Aste57867_19103 [Aphanomyces stellatus]
MPLTCRFNQCTRVALPQSSKCKFHKKRSLCAAPNCTNQTVRHRLCVRHGGKRTCQIDGCDAPTRGRKHCPKHGGAVPKRFCSVDGCSKQAHSNHKCVAHGGGRFCAVTECQRHVRTRGLCRIHIESPTDGPAYPKFEPQSFGGSSCLGNITTLTDDESFKGRYASTAVRLEDWSCLLDHLFERMCPPLSPLEDEFSLVTLQSLWVQNQNSFSQ